MDKEVSCIDSHMIKYFNQGNLIHITLKRYKIMKWCEKVCKRCKFVYEVKFKQLFG